MRTLFICILPNVSQHIKFNYCNAKNKIISDSHKYPINGNLNCLIFPRVTDLY